MRSLFLFIFFLSFSSFLVGQNTREELTLKAVESFNKEDFETSIDYFTCIIDLYPTDSIAFFDRGFVKDEMCDYIGAIEDFTEQIKIDPESADSYFLRGMVNEKLGKLDAAEADYKEVKRIDEGNADAHYFIGLLEQLKGKNKAAMKYFLETVEINPDHSGALNAIADLYCQKMKVDKGLIWLNRAIQSDSSFYSAYLTRAWINAEKGKNNDAIKDLEMAILLAGTVELNYPHIKKQKQQSEGILKIIQNNTTGKNDGELYKIARLLMLFGEFKSAETIFLAIDPNKIKNPNINYFLALSQMQLGKSIEALSAIDKMILADNNNAMFYLLRGKIKRELKSNLDWCDDYKKYLQLIPATFKIETWKECF